MTFRNKKLLITGGTGSFGNAVLQRFLKTDHFSEIRIFSRDEKKQDDMRNQLKNSRLKFFIGDVRDYDSVEPATRGADYIFHAAALKQVPSCEFFPMQAVKTNVEGTQNVIKAAGFNNVGSNVKIHTPGGILGVKYLKGEHNNFTNIVLSGPAKKVFEGVIEI